MATTYGTPTVQSVRPIQCNDVGVIDALAAPYVTEVKETGVGALRQTFIRVAALPITLADNGSTGSGGIKLYDFLKGSIMAMGGATKLAVAYSNVTDANLVGSIGSVTAAADGTLTSTEANFVQSTACATVSGVGALAGVAVAAPTNLASTGTAAFAFLNLATSSDPSTNNSVTVTGWIMLTWLNHGDVTID